MSMSTETRVVYTCDQDGCLNGVSHHETAWRIGRWKLVRDPIPDVVHPCPTHHPDGVPS